MKFAAYVAFSFITFFSYTFGYFFYHFMYGCMFCVLLFNCVNCVFFIVMFMYSYCYVCNILFFSVSLCCSVYCCVLMCNVLLQRLPLADAM
jgi:hypothetical protein